MGHALRAMRKNQSEDEADRSIASQLEATSSAIRRSRFTGLGSGGPSRSTGPADQSSRSSHDAAQNGAAKSRFCVIGFWRTLPSVERPPTGHGWRMVVGYVRTRNGRSPSRRRAVRRRRARASLVASFAAGRGSRSAQLPHEIRAATSWLNVNLPAVERPPTGQGSRLPIPFAILELERINALFAPACSSPPSVALRPPVAAGSPMSGASFPRRGLAEESCARSSRYSRGQSRRGRKPS
jgi:hypothetical protein